MKERRASQKLSSKSIMDPNQNVKCKIVVVGDSQCGKTALLHVFAKDCFPEVSVAGRGFQEGVGQWDSSPEVGFPAFTRFCLKKKKKVFLALATFPWLDCGERESALETFRVGTRLHMGWLAPETCSFLCA